MSENCDHENDPRYRAGVEFIIAGDAYAHAIIAAYKSERLASKVMRAVQLIVFDTTPDCMYKDMLIDAVREAYPEAAARERIIASAEKHIHESMGDREPSAKARAELAAWLRAMREG